jgi:hypothetical protein
MEEPIVQQLRLISTATAAQSALLSVQRTPLVQHAKVAGAKHF